MARFQCSVNERWSAAGPASPAAPQKYCCIVHTGMTKCSCGDYNYSYTMFEKTLNHEVNSCRWACLSLYETLLHFLAGQVLSVSRFCRCRCQKKGKKKTSQDYNITARRKSRERPSDKLFVTCTLRWCNHTVISSNFLRFTLFLNYVKCQLWKPEKM